MRGPLPLSDRDFAAVRAEVLRRIERPRRARAAEWVVLAASVVLAVLSIVAARVPAAAPARDPHYAVAVIPSVAVMPSVARDPEVRVARRPPVRVRHKHEPAPVAFARMEIRTADPDVRIIWITN